MRLWESLPEVVQEILSTVGIAIMGIGAITALGLASKLSNTLLN